MLSQGSQGAAGRAERSAARVGEGSASDRVVLEGAGLAARAEVRVCRRFHGRHAGVIGVQVGVIHLIHGDQPVRTPVGRRKAEGELWAERVLVCLQSNICSNQSEVVCLSGTSKNCWFVSPKLLSALWSCGSGFIAVLFFSFFLVAK